MSELLKEFIAHLAAHRASSHPLDPEAVSGLSSLATPIAADRGHVLTRQFAPARTLDLLVSGEVRFQIRLEEGNEDLDVGTSDAPWTPIGWSGFRSPERYATTVVCVSPCRVLRFPHAALDDLFVEHPEVGVVFLTAVLGGSLDLLATIRDRIASAANAPADFPHTLHAEGEEEAYNRAPPPLSDLLRRSAFFAVFDEAQLATLTEGSQSRYFCRGEPVLRQGSRNAGFWVLATGRVVLHYRPSEQGPEVVVGTLSTPGAVVAWAGCAGTDRHSTSLVATRDCTLYRLDPYVFDAAATTDPALALALIRRLLWLVSNHLRAARALFISRQFEHEILAVRNLLEQSCTELSVSSPLHRLPHLLQSAYTRSDAFACLEQMLQSTETLERSLAQLCIDILWEVKREHEFFEALRRVYHEVVTAPRETSAREVRKICARGFRDAYRLVRYVVDGAAYLPDAAGNIYIFNHLKNHEYNTLPNNFQLTLDSHFVSAVVLDPRYGDGGIRVVRKSRGTEYGHQNYYDRLGHISVYTAESDELHETAEQRRARRNEFFETAGAYLKAGTNLILSPEGTSYWTEDSPGPFKPGAFRLAASIEPEPRIVPLAVANFDRRVHSAVYAVLIKPPFRISELVSDPQDPDEMRRFLLEYQQTYATYVREARDLARNAVRVEVGAGAEHDAGEVEQAGDHQA